MVHRLPRKERPRTRSTVKGKAKKSEIIKQPICAVTCRSFRVTPSNFQHIGTRTSQEDTFAFSDLGDRDFVLNNGVLAIVADGMGGLAMGASASNIAVSTFLREYTSRDLSETVPQSLIRSLEASNEAVMELAYNEDLENEVGTTLVAAVIYRKQLHWISAGDSRVYLFRGKELRPLNKDHIYANQLAEDVINEMITREEAASHPERDFLTSYLGIEGPPEIDRSDEPLTLEPGDMVMLCSDGLYNTLTIKEITAVICKDSVHAAEMLVDRALSKNKKNQDNITVIILSCSPGE